MVFTLVHEQVNFVCVREIIFYKTANNKIPIEEFFESLSDKQTEKILWVLRLIKQLDRIPVEYFKKLESTNDIWEVRASSGNNEFRLLGFWHKSNFSLLFLFYPLILIALSFTSIYQFHFLKYSIFPFTSFLYFGFHFNASLSFMDYLSCYLKKLMTRFSPMK